MYVTCQDLKMKHDLWFQPILVDSKFPGVEASAVLQSSSGGIRGHRVQGYWFLGTSCLNKEIMEF